MGKWDEYLAKLTKLPPEHKDGGTDYQLQVNMAKGQITEKTPAALARRWKSLRAEEDDLELKAKAIRLQLRATADLMEESFEAEGLKKLELEDGASVSYQPEPHTYVKDKVAFHAWCLTDSDLAAKMDLMWTTTNSLAKNRMEAGQALPPGLEIFSKPKFVLRGA